VKEGVLVGERMQTSVPDLYAAGDVSQGCNLLTGSPQVIGLWANARYQGRTAGRNMVGIRETFPGNIPQNIVHFLGMDFAGMGNICEYDKMDKQFDGQRFRQLFWRDGRLAGANFLDASCEAGVIKNALLKDLRQNGSSGGRSLSAIQDIWIRKILAEVEKV
jgi:NAD(P)H-nitrite reductase large subunit